MKFLFLFISLGLNGALFAQDLVPATSEDLMEFDRQVSQHMKKDGSAKPATSAFGAGVAAEAKKLKEADKDQRKDFGKWVSDQRKKSDEDRPAAQGSIWEGSNNNSGTRGSSGREKRGGKDK